MSPIVITFLVILIYISIKSKKIYSVTDYGESIKKARKIIFFPISIIIGFFPYFASMYWVQIEYWRSNPSGKDFLAAIIFQIIALFISNISDIFDFVLNVYLLGDEFWKKYKIMFKIYLCFKKLFEK